jgi:hypothetical protein
MKKRNLFAAAIALLIAFSSCEKCEVECNLVAAKIIRYDCDRVIFQLLTTTPIGDPDWEDVQTSQRYSNVVSYYNICKIAEFANGGKTTLYVRIKNDTQEYHDLDCITCKAISPAPPQTKVDFTEISKSPCEITSGN